MKHSKPVSGAFAFLFCLGSLPAYAATVTHTNSWSSTPTPDAGPLIQNQNFERFDPALGTLTQVDWSINASLAAHFVVTSDFSFDYEFSATIKCSIEGIGCEDPFTPIVEKTQTVSGFARSILGSTPTADRTINLEFVGNVTTSHPSDLNFFTSTTPLDLELMSMASVMVEFCFTPPGQPETCLVPPYDLFYEGAYVGTLEYTYTYNPVVPIPAAVWLFGSGLIGLIGIARRKQSKRYRT